MTLTIKITPELEHQIKQAAKQIGLSPDAYVLQLLHQSLQPRAPQQATGIQLSKEEAGLIQTINRNLSDIEWQQYQTLIAKREAATLTPDEHDILITFSDRLEETNVNRIQAIADLAQLRRTSMDSLMVEMGLKPRDHAWIQKNFPNAAVSCC